MAKISSNTFKLILFLSFLLVLFLAFFRTVGPKSDYGPLVPKATHANGQHYIGSESCKECHAEIYKTHIETAHYKTSAPATPTSVKGSFETGHNTFKLSDRVLFKMTKTEDGLYQEVWDTKSKRLRLRSKMDIVVGSGVKGQSFLHWRENELFQLQLSYFTPSDSWANSPGMGTELLMDPRPANAKCLECHTTFAEATSLYGMGNKYNRGQIVYRVDCERCHGPSMDHVLNHRNHPELKVPSSILKYDTLTQKQRTDVCSLCHSGIRTDIKPAFLFLAGDSLENFSLPDQGTSISEEIDVHGNQYDLLSRSECFKQSPTMDCTTCHDPHRNQRGDTNYFNRKCMECHQNTNGPDPVFRKSHLGKGNDCIACHMPLKPSKSMRMPFGNGDVKIPVQVRTHFIDIYRNTTLKSQTEQTRHPFVP
ncbi:MAG: multiheme c-type cytochrome [Bacteroidota bacterium]